MNKWYSYLNSAQEIIRIYDNSLPFHHFIKQYFKQHKKFGSKDRKWVNHLCYCHFRMGKSMKNEATDARILATYFLTVSEADTFLNHFRPDWFVYLSNNATASLEARASYLNAQIADFNTTAIFPAPAFIGGIKSTADFSRAHLIQPDVYLRVRGSKAATVVHQLKEAGIQAQQLDADCLVVSSGTVLEKVVVLNKEVVVQDLSSQKVGNFLKRVRLDKVGTTLNVWDCCAASGGKSILAHDILGVIQLTVSDIRTSILQNLLKRLKAADMGRFDFFVADLAAPQPKIPIALNSMDLIIADVPCSGSGTWSRTPEQLLSFDTANIEYYASLQKRIVNNVLPYLAENGYLLYITCSVFSRENESMAAYLASEKGLQLVQAAYFEGYEQKADTLFAALFKKN